MEAAHREDRADQVNRIRNEISRANSANRFGQREAEDAEAEHLVAGGWVAGDGGHQRRENVADADTDAGERDHGKYQPRGP